ncbi:MAG: hypothetical protein ABI183_12770 [Polyangiaceae bacterium]
MKRIAWGLIIVAAAELVAVGCNAVLGNEAGILASADASTPNEDVVVTTTTDSGLSCGAGQKACFGTCKGTQDTTVGCSDPACVVCPSEAHASADCVGGSGGFVCSDTCRSGYDDCNGDLSKPKGDGCETDLTLTKTCGRCDNDCSNASQYPTQPEFCVKDSDAGTTACNTNCPYSICGANCFDLTKTTTNCGICGNDCSTQVTNGIAECVSSTCKVKSCDTSYHLCSNACVTVSDVNHCGTSCSPCPNPPPNATATCAADMSGNYSCSNTCNFITCGSTCCASGQACITGQCVTPPVCTLPKLACPLGCLTVNGACTGGCLDESADTTCGGDCKSGNDCTATPGEICCGAGSGSFNYSCQMALDDGGCP